MSPRGRAPWPPALTTGALNHLASFLPSLPPQQLVELGKGAAVRGAAGGRGEQVPPSCSELSSRPHNLLYSFGSSLRGGSGIKTGGGLLTRELGRDSPALGNYQSFEKCNNKKKASSEVAVVGKDRCLSPLQPLCPS